MASQTRTKRAGRPASGPVPARRPRRGWWAAGAAAAVLAAAVVWVVVDGQRDRPVAGPAGVADSFRHVHGLAMPEWAPGTVFLSTHHGLIRIQDGQWHQVSDQDHDFMGFAAHPTEPQLMYTSGHPAPGSGIADPVGLMVSTDGGASWQVRSLEGEVDLHAMSVGAGGAVLYGWSGAGRVGLFRSTDEGHTWQTLEAPELQAAGGPLALAAHPEDPDQVWAATAAGLQRSRDGGASWQPVVEGVPVTAVTLDPADPDRMLVYTASPGEGLMESLDGGASWSPTAWRLDESDDAAAHIAISPTDPQLVYLGSYREHLLRSTDGGRSWQPLARAGVPEG